MGIFGRKSAPKLTYDQLSPEERNAVDYHRRNLASGMMRKNPDGSGTSFLGAVEGLGPNETPTYYPTFWNGKALDARQAGQRAEQSGIAFPTYPSYDAALAREQQIHSDIMESDEQRFMNGDTSFLDYLRNGQDFRNPSGLIPSNYRLPPRKYGPPR